MLRFLIYIIAILPSITIITTYIIASRKHQLEQMIPFVSFSINYPPGKLAVTSCLIRISESCIGTFGVSISAFTLFCIMFVKYKHLETLIVKVRKLELSCDHNAS